MRNWCRTSSVMANPMGMLFPRLGRCRVQQPWIQEAEIPTPVSTTPGSRDLRCRMDEPL